MKPWQKNLKMKVGIHQNYTAIEDYLYFTPNAV